MGGLADLSWGVQQWLRHLRAQQENDGYARLFGQDGTYLLYEA